MKRTSVLLTSIVALLMLATGVLAGAATRIHATVPFDFYVGEEQLAAGNYVFEMRPIGFGSASSSAVAVYRPDGTFAHMIPTMPTGYDHRSGESHLHFLRYGNAYFLSKVEGQQSGAAVRKSKAEREYVAQTKKPQDTVLMASKPSLPAEAGEKSQLQIKPRLIVHHSDALR